MDELEPEFFDGPDFEYLPDVQKIISEVRKKKDDALKQFTLKFDRVKVHRFRVENDEMNAAYRSVGKDLIADIQKSAENLKKFSKRQLESFKDFELEIEPGIFLGQKLIPIERVGIYVPGGRYPLISSLLMGAVPAKAAGVEEIVVCSPPCFGGSIHPGILAAADMCGVNEVYKVGGVQAVAAMAFGTQSIKRVDKVVGPGNRYVNAAKKIVYGQVGIDFVAGATETLIIADKEANPSFIAADLIAQAEHDADAKPEMVTDSNELAVEVLEQIKKALGHLATAEIAHQSLAKNGLILIVDNLDEAVAFANRRAPEHLQLCLKNPEFFLPRLKNYGSLFIGEYSAEVLGDYSSGLNHILPTDFAPRYTGGLSVRDFIKIQSSLRTNKEGFLKIAPVARSMAEAEGLEGHVNSVAVRMKAAKIE